MLHILLAMLFVLCSSVAYAQPADIVVIPTSVTADWRAGTVETGVLAAKIGLVPCSNSNPIEADLLSPVVVDPPALGVIVTGTVTFDPTLGDQCFRGVVVGANGLVSTLSENALLVTLRPLPVILLPLE